MKKRLFLTFVMIFVFALTLAFAVSADTIHNENTVDYNATVTLDDGTVLPLFDENKEALFGTLAALKMERIAIAQFVQTMMKR